MLNYSEIHQLAKIISDMSNFDRTKEVQRLIASIEELHGIQLPSLRDALLLAEDEFIISVQQHIDILLSEDKYISAATSLLEGLLNIGYDIEWASTILNQNKLRKDLPEINKLEEYANCEQLKQYFSALVSKEKFSSVRAVSHDATSIMKLATHFRSINEVEKSNFILLFYAKSSPYNPWIEDRLARNALEAENFIAAHQHWTNITEKSTDIQVLEIASAELQSSDLASAIEIQKLTNDYSHLLFEEAYLDLRHTEENSTTRDPFDTPAQMAHKFMSFDDSLIKYLSNELNLKIWKDFKNDDPWHAARYFLRKKLVNGKTFLEAIKDDGGISIEAQCKRCETFVDKPYYFKNRPDLNPESQDALHHYVEFGWKEGTDPSPIFNTASYLASHPYLLDLNINPLYHYLCTKESNASTALTKEVDDFVSSLGTGFLLPQVIQNIHNEDDHVKSFTKKQFFDKSKFWNHQSLLDTDSKLVIHFVIPDFSNGSGGHMTIFRMIRHLEASGHFLKVWVISPNRSKHSVDMRDDVIKYFQPIKAKVLPLDSSFYFATGDCLIATSWQTVEYVISSIGFREKFYFVQDFEPYFYPRGAKAVLAEQTYYEDLACICASPWLNQLMKSKYSRWSRFIWLAYDENVYKINSEKLKNKYLSLSKTYEYIHIAVYVRSHTERRCVELVLDALMYLSQINDKFVVHFFGDTSLDLSVPYKAVNYGILNHEQLNLLYSKCLIGLSFSATNYSLMPQEMMAAGLAVFDIRVDSTEAIYPEGVINLMTPCVREIAQQLNYFINNPERLLPQAENALKWVNQFSWYKSGCDFEKALRDRINENHIILESSDKTSSSHDLYKQAYNLPDVKSKTNPKYKASVIIPLHNGGKILSKVLASLKDQITPWDFQCILIDSESTDKTVPLCREFIANNQNFSLVSISKRIFNMVIQEI